MKRVFAKAASIGGHVVKVSAMLSQLGRNVLIKGPGAFKIE
jgi:hypothetical protein